MEYAWEKFMGILNIFSRSDRLIEKVIKIYSNKRKEGYPHDLSIDKTLEDLFRIPEQISEVETLFKFLSVWVATVGNFEMAFYYFKLDEISGPLGELRDRIRGTDESDESPEIKAIAKKLKTAFPTERDLKLLAFTVYDFKFPVYPTLKVYEKRIKQINNIYVSLSNKYLQTIDMDPQTAFSVKKYGWEALETTISDLLREKYKEGLSPRGINRKDPYKYLIPDKKDDDDDDNP